MSTLAILLSNLALAEATALVCQAKNADVDRDNALAEARMCRASTEEFAAIEAEFGDTCAALDAARSLQDQAQAALDALTATENT